MDLTPYVNRLRDDLAVAAAAGGEHAEALAERLLPALDAAARLTLLDALTASCDEITRDIAPGSVEVRLRGRDVGFVVTPPVPVEVPEDAAVAPTLVLPTPDDTDDITARVNFRPPESLKTRIEEAARAEGLSVNAWLVRVTTAATEPKPARPQTKRSSWMGASFQGWVH